MTINDSSTEIISRELLPGEILKRVGVFDDGDDQHNSLGGDLLPPSLKKYGPCLKCTDEKGEEVFIPLAHRVLTFEVGEQFPCKKNKVVSTKAIIQAGNEFLPRMFSVIHGDPPLLPYSYTGLYRLYTVFTEETVLAATLDDPHSMCLELATDSCAKFKIALNDAIIKKTCEYTNANNICHKLGHRFLSGIKVSFSMTPVSEDIDFLEVDSSNPDNFSLDEVDANSEFDISWRPQENTDVNITQNSKHLGDSGISYTVERSNNSQQTPLVNIDQVETTITGNIQPSSLNSSDLTIGSDTVVNNSNPASSFNQTSPSFDQQSHSSQTGSGETKDKTEASEIDKSTNTPAIVEDIVEMSIEETDYHFVDVKKANEYTEISSSSSSESSDSETEQLTESAEIIEFSYSDTAEENHIDFDNNITNMHTERVTEYSKGNILNNTESLGKSISNFSTSHTTVGILESLNKIDDCLQESNYSSDNNNLKEIDKKEMSSSWTNRLGKFRSGPNVNAIEIARANSVSASPKRQRDTYKQQENKSASFTSPNTSNSNV